MNHTFFFAILFAVQILAISGCSSMGDMKGGFLHDESFNEYKARIAREEGRRKTTFAESSARTPNRSSLEHRPNKGLNYSSGFGPGVQVDNYGDTTTVITPFFGGGPACNQGYRDEKKRLRHEDDMEQLRHAQEKAVHDARRGEFQPTGFHGKYYPEYKRVFESEERRAQRGLQRERRALDEEAYHRGAEAYRDGR